MQIFGINFTISEISHMAIWLIIMFAIVIWAQTFRKKTYNIIGNSRWVFIISAIILIAGIYSLSTKGLNYGLDFTGGTIMQLGFAKKPNVDTLHKDISNYNPNFSDAVIQLASTSDGTDAKSYQKVLISVRGELNNKQAGMSTSQSLEGLTNFLKTNYGGIEIYKVEHIGPIIGRELKQKAIYALLIALIIQLFYITFRFGRQMRYGLAADLAMAHDLVLVVGLYSLFGRQADSPFLAALLTIVGYSIMDSIIIFDRIRENLRLFKSENFESIVNISVNQTMTRSINTLLTVLLTLFALYFFGGETLKNFAFALLIGLTTGAYSSIFVASPLLVMFDKHLKNKERKQAEARKIKLEAEAAKKKELKEAKIKKKN
ncbi:MAG: protein translocase subunit SecF [Armatimonadota bacterium]